MDKTSTKLLVSTVLDLGEQMLISGAEVSRVEDTMCRIFESYGGTADVLTITSSIVLTVAFENEVSYTQTRRIKTVSTNFDKLSKLNALSREICNNAMCPEDILEKLSGINKNSQPAKTALFKKIIGSVLAAGGFAVFFGGGAADFIIAGITAVFAVAFELFFKKTVTNMPAYYFMCTLFAGIITAILCKVLGRSDVHMVMIGFIMLVIPGFAFTAATRDMILGDTITGALKMLESLIFAAFIAGGVALSIVITGGLIG